jgi:hypothetical protein
MPIIESPKPAPAPMPIGQPPIDPSARRRRFRLIAFIVVVGLVLITGVGFAVATALEEQDPFCVSCHTAPEITYYNRAYIALDTANAIPEDLSTRHYLAGQANGVAFRCIDCHRGDSGLPHRVSAVALGAYDALIFLTPNRAGWPTPLVSLATPIPCCCSMASTTTFIIICRKYKRRWPGAAKFALARHWPVPSKLAKHRAPNRWPMLAYNAAVATKPIKR